MCCARRAGDAGLRKPGKENDPRKSKACKISSDARIKKLDTARCFCHIFLHSGIGSRHTRQPPPPSLASARRRRWPGFSAIMLKLRNATSITGHWLYLRIRRQMKRGSVPINSSQGFRRFRAVNSAKRKVCGFGTTFIIQSDAGRFGIACAEHVQLRESLEPISG
jgi:hypothetical protein